MYIYIYTICIYIYIYILYMYTGIIKRRDLQECKYFFQNLENFL